MIINKTVYPDVSVGTYTTVSNPVMDYDPDQELEHSIFYAGTVSENVQFCDETNYTYNATAPNCQFNVTPKDIVKGDVFFLSRGFRFFNFNDAWEYRTDQTYNIVTEFDISKFYFDMNQLTCQVYDLSNPDGGHVIGSASNMAFNTYRSQTAEYKKTHLIRSVSCNYVYGDSTSFCKYKDVANYYDVNVSPMIRYKFNDKTTIYAPVILSSYGIPDWQGPSNLNTLTGSGDFPAASSDIYSNTYTNFGKWYDTFTPGGPAHLVTAANIGAVTSFTVHAGNDQGQQVNGGYHIPDISNIDTDKYMIPVFVWGNSWNKRIAPFFTDEFLMRYIASFGLRFQVDSTMYIGYMQQDGTCNGDYILESQLADSDSANRNITDFSGSNYDANKPYIPPVPPSPEGDDFDGMVTGFTNNIGGSAKYWLLPSDPSGLFEDFFLHAPEGSSITQNILSCYVSALKIEWQTVAHKMVIYTNGSQKPAFESQATYNYIYQGNPHLVLGVFDVPRRTNTFYDFSPYTTYEVYVPFCGWIGLPDTVAGRKIRVYMDFDASICTCKARVECEANGENVIVGEISGTFGSPCPIQVTEGGLYRQAAINSALQIASGVASGTLGAATKHGGSLAIGGFSYALQGLTNAATAGNTNYSQTIGRTGDSSNLAGTSHYCYLRITHPEIDEVVNNTRFGHTVGYLCNTIGRIGDFEGFTVCGNPHVTGIACTESEKEEIKRMLEDGIIINSEEE